MDIIEEKFKSIYHKISKIELQKREESEENIDLEQILSNREQRNTDFFLGYYSPYGIEYAFESYGIFYTLNKLGFYNLKMKVEYLDFTRHKLSMYYEENNQEYLLSEIILRREFQDIELFDFHKHYEFLIVDWLYSQNPKKEFTNHRPQLPGQKYPGLHTGKIILELLILTSKRLKLSGIINIPQYFHNAQIYSKRFYIYSPVMEGKRLAIERDLLSKYNLATVSWGIEKNQVYENNKPFTWDPTLQIVPLRKSLYKYFNSSKYKKIVKETLNNFSYELKV